MEETKHIEKKDILQMHTTGKINIKPLWGSLIVTTNVVTEDEDGLLLDAVAFDEDQYVVAIGTANIPEDIQVGAKVKLNLNALTTKVQVSDNSYETELKVKLEPVMIDGVMYTFVDARHVKAVYR